MLKECRLYRCYDDGRQFEVGGSCMTFLTTYHVIKQRPQSTYSRPAARLVFLSATARNCSCFCLQPPAIARVSVCNRPQLLVFLSATARNCSCFCLQLPATARVSVCNRPQLLVFLSATARNCSCFCQQPPATARVSVCNRPQLLVFLSATARSCSCFCLQPPATARLYKECCGTAFHMTSHWPCKPYCRITATCRLVL